MKSLVEISEKELEKRISKSKDLYRIAKKYKMTERLILEIAEKLKIERFKGKSEDVWWWREVSVHQPLTEGFISKHIDKLNVASIFSYQNLSEQFILQNQSNFNLMWRCISSNKHLTEEFIEKYKKKIDWRKLCRDTQRTEEFIEKYIDFVNWDMVSLHQTLSEEFILKHQDNLNLGFVAKNKSVAKDFFERKKEQITTKLYAKDLERIIRYQDLSEQTLREIKKGKTVWKAISLSSDVSKEFVIENYANIDHRCLAVWNRKVSKDIKDEVKMIERMSGNNSYWVRNSY